MNNFWWVKCILMLGATFMLAANSLASEPAFDCSKAEGEVESLICQDTELAALDQKMQQVFDKAMVQLPAEEVKRQKAMQRGWIKGRNECWKANDVRDCTEFAYTSRIVELQIISGQLEVPPIVSLDCGDNSQPFTAVFYHQTEPASMVLTRGDDQVIALAEPMASGIKYLGQNVEYSEHQGKITINWLDTTFECKVRQ
ncbi:MliC family protein [Photobacterium sp. DA100]|uniref:MliC family protein n=1 Tax=Photobacterium sp. DA100 TaxID=3027472 RepID=UPI00247A5B95|nr:MliC family protein [Photobacterium sp. DA100]WEM41274.1 MliC family protein [Photobacterium sp. DA100]